MIDILLETFKDSLKMLPFLFGAYLLIEYIESKSSSKMRNVLMRFGRFGTVGGALLGCVPQCGFSAAASNLYANRVITVGTLIAVFVSTSDEAIPVLLSHPDQASVIIKLLLVKVIIAIIAGFVTDILFSQKIDIDGHVLHEKHHDCNEHNHSVIKSALKHTVNIFLFIFVVSFVLHVVIHWVGEEKLSVFFMTDSIFQPIIAAVIGFIPNCASSIVLTQLYIEGTISFGSVVAGLCTGAGIGLAVLFKENKNLKENFKIMATLFVVAAISGVIIQIFA